MKFYLYKFFFLLFFLVFFISCGTQTPPVPRRFRQQKSALFLPRGASMDSLKKLWIKVNDSEIGSFWVSFPQEGHLNLQDARKYCSDKNEEFPDLSLAKKLKENIFNSHSLKFEFDPSLSERERNLWQTPDVQSYLKKRLFQDESRLVADEKDNFFLWLKGSTKNLKQSSGVAHSCSGSCTKNMHEDFDEIDELPMTLCVTHFNPISKLQNYIWIQRKGPGEPFWISLAIIEKFSEEEAVRYCESLGVDARIPDDSEIVSIKNAFGINNLRRSCAFNSDEIHLDKIHLWLDLHSPFLMSKIRSFSTKIIDPEFWVSTLNSSTNVNKNKCAICITKKNLGCRYFFDASVSVPPTEEDEAVRKIICILDAGII